MPDVGYTLDETLGDANAFFRSGDARSAADILLEGLDQFGQHGDAEAILRLQLALGDMCVALWSKRDFQAGREITAHILNHTLARLENAPMADALSDREFLARYVEASALSGTPPFPLRRLFRHRNLVALFERVLREVDGAVAECGCARGLSFLQLCLAFGKTRPAWQGEGFHVFDSFQGLSEPGEHDLTNDASEAGAMAAANRFQGNFAVAREAVETSIHGKFPKAQLHAGWIPECFRDMPELVYAFVHVDVDLYQPTRDSLEYFFPRLALGGAIITDDYNWPGARQAFDAYFAAAGCEIRVSNTHQAYVIKP